MRRVLVFGALLLLAVLALVLGEVDAPATRPDTASGAAAGTTAPVASPAPGSGPGSSTSSNKTTSEVTAASDRCRVTGPLSLRVLVEQLADLCEPSARTVDAAWGSTWAEGARQQTRLVVAGDVESLAELLERDNTDGLTKTAAITVGPKNSPADAVYINGPAFVELSDLGREVVLTHELVHVASRATGDWSAPTWLEEGFADYVAYRHTDLAPRQIAEAALDAPLPRSLPQEKDFDAAGSGAAIAYGRSWAAVMLLAERLGGDAAMKSFYQRTADGGFEAALGSVGFEDETQFLQAWRAEIQELARR